METRLVVTLRQKHILAIIVALLVGAWFLFWPDRAATICKWVDEKGVTHYAEVCPEETEAEEVELEAAPTEEQIREAQERSAATRSRLETGATPAADASPDVIDAMPGIGQPDYSRLSLSELEQLCEAAREERLAPEREQLIENCVQEGKDRGYCERFYADHGDPKRVSINLVRQALYYDLPECLAWQEAGGKIR